MTKERILFLDVAKAICIILVVVGHYVPAYSPGWYVGLHDVIYTFHMPLFMFASGYIYMATRKETGYGSFLMRKVRRLMVPYFATSAFIITFKLATQGQVYVENPVSVFSYLKMFYMPEAGYFLWFIWALWWMFVLVHLFKTRNARYALFAASLLLHFLPVTFPKMFCLEEFRRMFVYFMAGVFVCESKAAHAFVAEYRWVQMASVIFIFLMVESLHFSNIVLGGGNKYLLKILLPYAGILFVLEISKLIVRLGRMQERGGMLLRVSAASYIIYLFHTTFLGMAKAIVHKLTIDHGIWYVFIPEAVVVILCGVIFPIFLFNVSKRYRMTRVLFGL